MVLVLVIALRISTKLIEFFVFCLVFYIHIFGMNETCAFYAPPHTPPPPLPI